MCDRDKEALIPDPTAETYRLQEADSRPRISVVVPAYNEEAVITTNLSTLCRYLEQLQDMYRWELILVNDGSSDATGELAEAFAEGRDNVLVLHHQTNLQLGQALRYAFSHCRGDYVVTFDCDLSYAPSHIGQMVTELRATNAKIVIASPYAREGRTTRVPFSRRFLSKSANRFLATMARGDITTLTGMVRAYDGTFLSTLNLRSMGTEINTEILWKAQLLGAKVVEVPAHLDWTFSQTGGARRRSPISLASSTNAYFFSGFMFRPVLFFIVPGGVVLVASLYTLAWVAFRFFHNFPATTGNLNARITDSIEMSYAAAPYAFVVGGVTLLVAIQLISLGIVALQSERYFKEAFHIATTVFRAVDGRSEITKLSSPQPSVRPWPQRDAPADATRNRS